MRQEKADPPGGALPQPGIGLSYIADLPAELYAAGLLDFVELTPEALCHEVATATGRHLALREDALAEAQARCGALPIAVHGVELSIGSAHGMNDTYLAMLDRLQAAWPFLWHSEHLHFQTLPDGPRGSRDIGVPLPLPATEEAACLLASRAAAIGRRYGVPFLLENGACYLRDVPAEPALGDDIGLLNRIATLSGCGQLLDLHNLHCNAINLGIDALAALARIDLGAVVEIHLAGGQWDCGFYTDAHSGAVPEPVWDLLAACLPRTPRLRGVVFEILETHALSFGAGRIAREVERARASLRQARPALPVAA